MTEAQIAALVAAAVKAALAQTTAAKPAKNAKANTAKPKIDRSAKNEADCIKAFKKAGFGTVTPRVDVMTFGLWAKKGLTVKKGEHAVKVNNLRLFHVSQVEPIQPAEKEETTPVNSRPTLTMPKRGQNHPVA
jgi:hypothetical protein